MQLQHRSASPCAAQATPWTSCSSPGATRCPAASPTMLASGSWGLHPPRATALQPAPGSTRRLPAAAAMQPRPGPLRGHDCSARQGEREHAPAMVQPSTGPQHSLGRLQPAGQQEWARSARLRTGPAERQRDLAAHWEGPCIICSGLLEAVTQGKGSRARHQLRCVAHLRTRSTCATQRETKQSGQGFSHPPELAEMQGSADLPSTAAYQGCRTSRAGEAAHTILCCSLTGVL